MTQKAYYLLCFYYFFFQAEDGIRDGHVTGVQTCALPISATRFAGLDADPELTRTVRAWTREDGYHEMLAVLEAGIWIDAVVAGNDLLALGRSEEHTSELQSRGHLVCCLLLEKI